MTADRRPRPIALAAGSMLDQPAETVIEVAAAAGFDAVGLRLSGEHAVADPSALGELATRCGVTIHDCEVYRIGREASDPTPLLEASAAAGASRVLVVSDLDDRADTLAGVADLVDRCRPLGLMVGLEYMAWTDPSEPHGAVAVADATGCTVVVDLLHHVRVGGGVDELDAIVESGTLGWVQLCDATRSGAEYAEHTGLIHEARHGRLQPGAGELPLHTLLTRVPAGVVVSVEVQSDALLTRRPLDRAQLLFLTSSALLDQSPSSTG